jgi:hypothetical protein
MQKYISLLILLLALTLGGCKPKQVVTQPGLANVQIPAQAPYTVSLQNPVQMGTDSLQSYVIAEVAGKWLTFGGRTNGFHGTGGANRTFPTSYANTLFRVYDPVTKQRWTASYPARYAAQLSSTNMQYWLDEGILWVAGGYGCSDGSSSPACYETFPSLLAIEVAPLVQAIMRGETAFLDGYITSLRDERFRVTGGVLRKLGSNFYLVMGHNYDTIYVNGISGKYTEEIRRFNLRRQSGAIEVSNYTTIKDPQFHRRDLNVLEACRPGGQPGLNVWGGVFTPNSQQGEPYLNPILIDQNPSSGATSYRVDYSFQQQFNLYECANVLLYDRASQAMYTSMVGGITNKFLDAGGNIIPGQGFMPWSKWVTTIGQFANGQTVEYPQANPILPGFIGANCDIILNHNLPIMPGTTRVIDYAALPAGDNLIGWMYGGILSTAPQMNVVSNPSFALATIYEVHIRK